MFVKGRINDLPTGVSEYSTAMDLDLVTHLLIDPAEQVVKAGLLALERGRVVKVVGGLNQFLPLLDRLMPRWAVRWVMGGTVKTPRALKAQNVERRTT